MRKVRTPEPEGFKALPSQEYLRECFQYDEVTGKLYWRARPLNHFQDSPQRSARWKCSYQHSRFAGREAMTSDNGLGHAQGRLDGRKVYAHRVIWKLVHGDDPDEVDHINGDPRDNRICNLRSVSHQVNLRNLRLRKTNTSGVAGVARHSSGIGWGACIAGPGGRPLAKYFKDFDAAVAWRRQREREFGYL